MHFFSLVQFSRIATFSIRASCSNKPWNGESEGDLPSTTFFLVWQIGLPRFTWLPTLHPQPNANGSRIYGGETPHRHLSQQNGKRRWVTERGESALFSFSTIDPLLILPFSRNKGATKCTINSVLVQIIIPCHSIPKPLISAAPLPFLENSF